MKNQTFISHSVEQTREFAKRLAQELYGGSFIAFKGGLGAGKTAFITGLAEGLGIRDAVSSPTYTLLHHYRKNDSQHTEASSDLYHFDMFRISGYDDLESTGFFDYLSGDAILAVEWSENIQDFIPDGAIIITMEVIGENIRKITIKRECQNKGE
ncbi:MAG: tRNA (adenosine(37)-N6)-threonylcarbamoyltransferase complex ATPase subunit type 1 TsaE [Oscillospiraceae bacterium]|nr:tRNA (adenosine(37)-N6)-threonylcarbamoyltransferase complex ATPase subunit type 1 TsaE [Oscillospiraceae bacterium]